MALERTALRSESLHMRALLASAATQGTLTFAELSDQVLRGSISALSIDPYALGRLAYVVALQDRNTNDTVFATRALETVTSSDLSDVEGNRFSKLLAELYFEQGRFNDLSALATRYPDIRTHFHSYLTVDAVSPFRGNDLGEDEYERWLRRFNWQFSRNDLKTVHLYEGNDVPFNRLTSQPELGPQPTGPLVTVIMTSFKPIRGDVLQATRSILEQTWRPLELLIVDDASPSEYGGVLDEVEELDERVRVIRLQVNGGTYAARNVGIAQAKGDFITGQDSDDWSHPQRIQTQVNDLLHNPHRPGNQVYTVNMTEDLVRIRRGYGPFIPSAPTLMVRTHIMRELGGYIPARKASDNEMRDRLSAYAGNQVYAIPEPLIFMRILPDSLSRSDFRPGWQHPARRAFWSSYRTWHASASRDELRRAADDPDPIYVPPRFTTAPQAAVETKHLDVVFAADWCEDGATQAAALKELRELMDGGYRVGVMHLENAIHLSRYARTYNQSIQKLISDGEVTHVIPDETFYDVTLILVRIPELLQFMPHGRVGFHVHRVAAVADKPVWQEPGFVVRYLPADCAQHAKEFFGARPVWIPTSPTVRDNLSDLVNPGELTESDYRTPFDPGAWAVPRRKPNPSRPVIGRWAGETAWQWPEAGEQIQQIWPMDGSADVRFYGNPAAVLKVLGRTKLPEAWLSFQVGDIDRRTYYRSLDFFVHYPQQRAVVDLELPVLEALAAGCVAVLPPWMEHLYGESAVYADPEAVQRTLAAYMRDRHSFMQQSRRGVEFARTHQSSDYRKLIDAVIAGGNITAQEDPPR
ncbi:glycosyltransferase family 2 protein [Nesterenkonia natronophila]|uniref:glycosyltransferase family 2 protein n=1 Tax=Nesterenkonia natronophila TaxID=2174932 RepID=UPI001314B35D|nr:glycosyltransferase family A protein [Nesterenkonia natronophila]